MAGSLRRVKGTDAWELRVYLGRDEMGRVQHRHARFRGTKREAERALARLSIEAAAQSATTSSDHGHRFGTATSLNDAITAWQENGWDDLSPTTVRHYAELWDRYLKKTLGRRKIVDLSPYDIERYFRRLRDAGVGHTTIRHVRAMMNRACRLARKWSGNKLPNPVSDTELPSRSLAERNELVRAPNVDEIKALVAAADTYDERFGVYVRVVAATGIRRGEASALRWSDVDWGAPSITVDESIVAAKGGAVVKAPKTRASIRRLAVDSVTLGRLRDLCGAQEELARLCGLDLDPDGFVFSVEPGGRRPPHPDAASQAFTKVRKLAGVASDVHLHSLRHFQATVLDPVLSERQKQARLGWATVHMAHHYTDALPEADRLAAEHLGRLLDGDEAS